MNNTNAIYTQNTISKVPEVSGIYLFKNNEGEVLYIGKAKNLRSRLKSHFQKSDSWKEKTFQEKTTTIEIVRLSSDFEALIQESELIRKFKPKYNVIWKDDKHYIYILVTKEEYPKVRFARRIDEGKGHIYGPYPSAGIVRDLIAVIRTIIPFCTQKNLKSGRSCFYHHLGLCNPCPSEIIKQNDSEKEKNTKIYKKNLTLVRNILEGKVKVLEHFLEKEMQHAKESENFEQAALFRDRLKNLEKITQFANYHESPKTQEYQTLDTFLSEQQSLIQAIGAVYPKLSKIEWIECYDISNTQGKEATGSMVTFSGGEPFKDRYRRFKIRVKDTPDDFSMMKETLGRRLNHKEWQLPDLIVIDGGKGQVHVAKQVLLEKNIDIPLIGLAKRLEEIVIPKGATFEIVRLKRNDKGLHLLQRVRDEAHRFAHKYHEHLRLKKLIPKS